MLNAVLLVDDDPTALMVCQLKLELSSFCRKAIRVEDASSAIQFLKSLTDRGEKLPELLLLDINMPGMNGWEMIEELEAAAWTGIEKMQVYMLTSSLDPEDRVKAGKYSLVKGFISKPLRDKDLDMIRYSPELRDYFS